MGRRVEVYAGRLIAEIYRPRYKVRIHRLKHELGRFNFILLNNIIWSPHVDYFSFSVHPRLANYMQHAHACMAIHYY